MAKLMVGTSGWVYPHWKGTFYPDDLKQSEWFAYYTERFNSVELNNTFYHLPPRSTFEGWRQAAPAGFRFTVKANQYITHRKKLKDPENGLSNFYENLAGLGRYCAAVLFQLPPHWQVNLERFDAFLKAVPKGHRIVFEFRDRSWLNDEIFRLLRKRNAALCTADKPFYPAPRVRTADFVFYRLHGGHHKTAPGYDRRELSGLAAELSGHLEAGRDAFAYFNNDWGGYAADNAVSLRRMIEGKG